MNQKKEMLITPFYQRVQSDDTRDTVCEYLRQGRTLGQACAIVGIHVDVYRVKYLSGK